MKISEILNNQREPLRSLQQIVEINDRQYNLLSWAVYNIGLNSVCSFEIDTEWKEVYRDLLYYFTGNERKYDLKKGIYLYGTYGVGKTTCMNVFSKFLAYYFPFSPNGFGLTSVEKLADKYRSDGSLEKYGRNNGEGYKLCINEFGKSVDSKHYGTNVQGVINSLLMVRYEIFQEKGILTHATSNYAPENLECFDDALLDRFSEMFNFIEIKGISKR